MHINPKEFYTTYPENSINLGKTIVANNGIINYQNNHKSIFATIGYSHRS